MTLAKPLFPKNLIFVNEREVCNRPPDGWYCTRTPHHDGPCAAWPRQQPPPLINWNVVALGFIIVTILCFIAEHCKC